MFQSVMSLKSILTMESKRSNEPKPGLSVHPWNATIKDCNRKRIMRAHNSTYNPVYPNPKKDQKPYSDLITFTVIGNRVTKEFIYCVKMVQGMHKYRCQSFGAPIIQGVTGVEWPFILKELKCRHHLAHCLRGQVAVLQNGYFLGGEEELKNLIEKKYIYHMLINYPAESIDLFRHFIKSTGRACAYLHISVNDKPIGSLMFMLYSDIVPSTCENFLRLCQTKKGGYSGTPVHRIVEGGWIQCGGFGLKDTPLGCENFIIPHDKRGVLGMCNANRGIDCSTQFYILLQPAPWMNHQYVAFGQLVDGDETLKKIQDIPTFYESPVKTITIYKAGILNIECDDIMINRGAVAYIDSHIDDLVSIAEMLYEWLLQLVESEIEAKHIEMMEAVITEVMGIDSQGGGGTESKSQALPESSEIASISSSDAILEGEFSGEDQFNKPYSYQQTSEKKEKRPYYIPLTDVPYPGEKDSNFDLKRLLQGDYCLEADLDPNQPKTKKEKNILNAQQNTVSAMLIRYDTACDIENSSSTSSSANDDSIDDPEEQKVVEEYLKEYGGKICFAGKVVRNIGKHYKKDIFLRNKDETFADEEIRRIRLALQDLRSRSVKKVSILASPWETHKQIKRRQTGVSPLNFSVEDDDEDDVEDDENNDKKKVQEEEQEDKVIEKKSIVRLVAPSEQSPHHSSMVHRRQTGYKRSVQMDDPDDVTELDEEDEKGKELNKVRISSGNQEFQLPPSKSLLYRQRGSLSEDQRRKTRPSVLIRLYEDVAVDNENLEPRLIDYKPRESRKESRKDSFLSDDNLNNFLKKGHQKLSDSLHTISSEDIIASHHQNLTKKRPTLTISAYKAKNQAYAEMMKEQKKKEKQTTKLNEQELIAKLKRDHEALSKGLRLPGDTPLYLSETSLDN